MRSCHKITRSSKKYLTRMAGPKYRKARMLRDEGYSYSQIGEVLDCSSGSAWKFVNLPQTVTEGRNRKHEYALAKHIRANIRRQKK